MQVIVIFLDVATVFEVVMGVAVGDGEVLGDDVGVGEAVDIGLLEGAGEGDATEFSGS
jgi:hypothetical protein